MTYHHPYSLHVQVVIMWECPCHVWEQIFTAVLCSVPLPSRTAICWALPVERLLNPMRNLSGEHVLVMSSATPCQKWKGSDWWDAYCKWRSSPKSFQSEHWHTGEAIAQNPIRFLSVLDHSDEEWWQQRLSIESLPFGKLLFEAVLQSHPVYQVR